MIPSAVMLTRAFDRRQVGHADLPAQKKAVGSNSNEFMRPNWAPARYYAEGWPRLKEDD